MTTEVIAQPQQMTPDRVDRGLTWLKHSLPSLRDDPETRKSAQAAVVALSEPAHPAKVMARVLALLNPYFDKDTPQAIREIEAEDWAEALSEYPYWAIERAARWWKSDANDRRRHRPLEGDLVARVRVEMDAISAARIVLAAPVSMRTKPEPRPELSEDELAARRARLAEVAQGMVENMRFKMEGKA